MATIRRIERKSGIVYKAIIKQKGVDLKSKTFSLKRDAIAWAKRIEADHEAMESLGSRGAGLRFSELVDEYIKQWEGKSDTQIAIAGYWVDVLGSFRLADIKPEQIRQQLKSLQSGHCKVGAGRGKTKGLCKTIPRTRSNATVNRYRTVLSAIFKYAFVEGYITINPVSRVPAKKLSNQRTRFLTEDERRRLLLACKQSDWAMFHVLVLMALTTGMRRGELAGLRWCDVDFDKSLAFLEDTKNGESRYCPIPDFVMAELKPFRQVGTSPVFASPTKPDRAFEFQKHWIKALAVADIKSFRWHDLRHDAASTLAMNGATLYEVGQVLGHKSTQTTQRYAHLSTDHKSELVNRIMTKVVKL